MSVSDTRLFVGRLSRYVKERDLEETFNRYGKIKNCSIKGSYGFVEFEDPRDAKDALGLDGYDLEGSKIAVEYSRGLRRDRDSRDRRYDDRRDDRYRDDRRYDDRRYDDRRDDRRGGYGRDRPPSRYRNTDYRAIIEDIPSGCSWQDLKDHFRSAGDVCFADIRRDRNGRDYGVVEFKYESDLTRAVEDLDRTRIHGTTIRVVSDFKKRSQSPRRRSPSPRRGDSRSPVRRSPSPRRGASRSPARRSPSRSPARRTPSPRRHSRSPARRTPSPRRDSRSPARRSPSRSPARRTPSPRRDSRSEDRS